MIGTNTKPKCEECGQSFTPENGWERFCSDTCAGRNYAHGYFKEGLAALANNHPRNEKQIAVMKQGIRAGLSESEIIAAVKSHWGEGRQPDERELERAYDVALESAGQPTEPPRPGESKEARRKRKEAESAQRALEDKHRDAAALEAMQTLAPEPMTFEQLIDKSPVPLRQFCLEDYPGQAAALLLRTLYKPDDLILCCMGVRDVHPRNLCTPGDDRLLQAENVPSHLCCNPLTGETHLTEYGNDSCRADSHVKEYRYTVFESDIAPLEIQAAFLWGRIQAGWPIASITYSGGKSLHALIRVDGIETAEQWKQEVREDLFPLLITLGADKACSNPSRLTRLPGHRREDNGKRQTLLWLAMPESDTEPPQAHFEPEAVKTRASVFEPFTSEDLAYLESVL